MRINFMSCLCAVWLFALLLCGCSSAPSKPAEISTERNLAASELETAYTCISAGEHEIALAYIADAKKRAVAVDDASLRVESAIAQGAAYLSAGDPARATAEWRQAQAEAAESGLPELQALAAVYLEKAKLGGATAQEAAVISGNILAQMQNLSDSKIYTAFAWQTLGLSRKAEGNLPEAEACLQKAFEMHEKELYLDSAAFDWFAIASVRSSAGNYDGALEALEQALAFDRRCENKYGVGSDWLARGTVLQKAGRTEEAKKAFVRAEEIFTAAGFQKKADEARQARDGLSATP